MRTILCTGSRTWQDEVAIYNALVSIAKPFRIIVGDANGADAIFWKQAAKLEVPRQRHNARWGNEGRAAGPKRNLRMLAVLTRLRAAGHPTFVLAAWDGKSRGTKHMIDQAKAAGFDVWPIH